MFRKRLVMMGMAFVVALSVAACGGDEARGDASPSLGGGVSIDIEDIAHGEGESEEESEEVKKSDKEEDASIEVAKTETLKDEKSKSKDSGNESSSNKSSRNGSNSGNSGGSSSKPSGGSNTPVKQECTHDWVADYKTVHHDAVTHVVHHPAGSHTVHHDAVTHTVHHDAVTHTVHHDAEGYWTQRQWVVTQAANPGTTVTVLHCDCGFFTTSESAMTNHCEAKLLEGDYSHGKGWNEQVTQGATPEQGYWKEPEWIQTKAAWDEVVVDKAAYDEVVVDKAAWDETVVDSKAWDETVVDKAAYDEKVINGYHCSKCGKKK